MNIGNVDLAKYSQWCIKGHDLQSVCFKQCLFSINGIDILTDLFLSPKYRLETLVACVLLPNTLAIRSQTSSLSFEAPHTEIFGDSRLSVIFPPNALSHCQHSIKSSIHYAKAHDSADDKIGSIAIFTGGGYNLITS